MVETQIHVVCHSVKFAASLCTLPCSFGPGRCRATTVCLSLGFAHTVQRVDHEHSLEGAKAVHAQPLRVWEQAGPVGLACSRPLCTGRLQMLWPDNDAVLPPGGTSHTTKLCAELSDIAVGGPWRNPESCYRQAY